MSFYTNIQLVFVLAFLTIAILTIGESQNICVWGRIGTMEIINAEWEYIGFYNDTPYYKLNIDASFTPNTQYLWRSGTQYQMTDHAPGSNGSEYNAKCMKSTANPIDCGSNWRIVPETSNDINIFVQNAPCPSWSCDAISIEIEPICYGIFDRKIASNAWSNTNNVTFYFHPSEFRWLCGPKYDLTYNSVGYAWTAPYWTQASKGDSVSLYFEYPTNDKGLYTVNCISNTISTSKPTSTPLSEQLTSTSMHTTSEFIFDKPTEINDNSIEDMQTIVIISCVLVLISGVSICGYLHGRRKHNNSNKNVSDKVQCTVVNVDESIEKQTRNNVNDSIIKASGFTRGNSNFVIPGLSPRKASNNVVYQELEGVFDKSKNGCLSKGSEELYGNGIEISDEENNVTTKGEAAESMTSLIQTEGVTKGIGDI